MSTPNLTLSEDFIQLGNQHPLKSEPSHCQGSAGLGQQARALAGHRAGPVGVQGRDAWVGGQSMVQRWSEVNGWCFRKHGAITSCWPMEALWDEGRRHCIAATKPGLQVACIPSHLPKTVRVGEAHLILVQLGATLLTHSYSQRQESGSAPLSVKCEMSLFVLFRSAWKTALGSFPASWRMTILLSLYTSKCSVGICRSTMWALHKCLREEREILKLSLVGISTAGPHVQPPSLCRKDFCPVSLQSPGTANYSPISFPDTTGMRGERGRLNHRSLGPAYYWMCLLQEHFPVPVHGSCVVPPSRGDAEAPNSTIPSPHLMVSRGNPLLGMGRYSLWDFIWSPLTAKVDCR